MNTEFILDSISALLSGAITVTLAIGCIIVGVGIYNDLRDMYNDINQ